MKDKAAITEQEIVSLAEKVVTTQRVVWDAMTDLMIASFAQPQFMPLAITVLVSLRGMAGAFHEGLKRAARGTANDQGNTYKNRGLFGDN